MHSIFHKAIDLSEEIGAKHTLGQAILDLGLLYKEKGKPIWIENAFLSQFISLGNVKPLYI